MESRIMCLKILNAHQNCDVIYEQTFRLSVNQLVEFVKVSWFIIILLSLFSYLGGFLFVFGSSMWDVSKL